MPTMGSYENLFALPSSGVLKYQNGTYLPNSLTATLRANYGFVGVVNGNTLLHDSRYLRKAEGVYVNVNDARDQFVVNWLVDNRTPSNGQTINFQPTGAVITGLDASDDPGQYRLSSMRLEDYWSGGRSNLKFQNYSVSNSPSTLTLLAPPNYSYAMSAATTVAEGNSVEFTITRSGGSGFASTVWFSTLAGTAQAGTDFGALNKIAVLFQDNDTQKVVRVKAVMDRVVEGNEDFSGALYLSNATTAQATVSRQVSIINTEPTFSYTGLSGITPREGGLVTFVLTRSGSTDLASTAFVSTASGTATSGTDFNAFNKLAVEFGAGVTTRVVTVQTLEDIVQEGDENFSLQVFGSASDTIPIASILGNIGNKDSINITGTAIRDALFGNAFDNVITGLGGADVLTGGAGRDIFRYRSVSDSGVLPTNMDTITDFRRGEDKIDLSAIDANPALAGDQAFNQIIGPTAAFSAPGQIKINHNGGHNYTIFMNTNTSLAAEAAIKVQLVGVNPGNTASLNLTDLIG